MLHWFDISWNCLTILLIQYLGQSAYSYLWQIKCICSLKFEDVQLILRLYFLGIYDDQCVRCFVVFLWALKS